MKTGDKTQRHSVTTSTPRKDERSSKWQIYPTPGGLAARDEECEGCHSEMLTPTDT